MFQVVQTDEAVFEAIQDKFMTLTLNLLPKLVSDLLLQVVLRAPACSCGGEMFGGDQGSVYDISNLYLEGGRTRGCLLCSNDTPL